MKPAAWTYFVAEHDDHHLAAGRDVLTNRAGKK
jgi:hypothetical protein